SICKQGNLKTVTVRDNTSPSSSWDPWELTDSANSRDTLLPGKLTLVVVTLLERYDLDPDHPFHDEIALARPTSNSEGQAATSWDNCESCIDETSQDSRSTTSPTNYPAFKSLQHISYAEAMKSESAATVSHEVSTVTSHGVLSHESLAGVTDPPDTRRVYDSQALNLQIRNRIVREPTFRQRPELSNNKHK
ncbi:hypothetical protein J6590_106399, partial [Homalodisca vitripennis]